MNQEFAGLPISRPFGALCGDPWPGFQILLWGPKGEGKSTAALILLATLVPYATAQGGVCWYVNGEEGVGPGLQLRAERTGIAQDALSEIVMSGYDPMSRQDFQNEITERNCKWIVVDSVQTLGFDGRDIWRFLNWSRENNVGVILIAHAKKDASDYKGDSALAHWVDCVIHVYRENGTHYGETEKSRALDRLPKRQILPPSLDRLGKGPSPSLVERSARANPSINCENWPDKDPKIQAQCKAIFAYYDNLDSNGESDAPEEAIEQVEKTREEAQDEREAQEDAEQEEDSEDDSEQEPEEDLSDKSASELLADMATLLESATG